MFALVMLLSQLGDGQAVGSQTLIAGKDYVQGELLVTFSAEHMPSRSSVSLEARQFGIAGLDSVLSNIGCREIRKLYPKYGWAVSAAGKRIDRTFGITYDSAEDAQVILQNLSESPYFERVTLNEIVTKKYHGNRQALPPTNTIFANADSGQWYFHHPANDSMDIDAPEAWAIEKGSSDIVVVIHDSGIMVDTSTTDTAWNLHGDFDFHWTSEDTSGLEALNRADLNFTDANDDELLDNVIGYNWAPPYRFETDSTIIRFWHSIPHDWRLQSNQQGPTSSECGVQTDHGSQVAGIAVAGFANGTNPPSGGDISGMAPACKLYVVRTDFGDTSIEEEATALVHAATIGDVVNMSWGSETALGTVFKDAVETAVNDLDCVLVASTGNDSLTNLIGWPSAYDEVLAVGAVDTTYDGSLAYNGRTYLLSGYSNYDADEGENSVDLVAPVDNGIITNSHEPCESEPPTCPCEQEEIVKKTNLGTSFAAPQVTGVVALIRSRYPGIDADSVMTRIKRAAEFYSRWETETDSDAKYGAGKVNAYRSITEWGRVATDSNQVATWGAQSGVPDTYYVSGDLVIEEGETLIINKGTTIRIAPDPWKNDEINGNDVGRQR